MEQTEFGQCLPNSSDDIGRIFGFFNKTTGLKPAGVYLKLRRRQTGQEQDRHSACYFTQGGGNAETILSTQINIDHHYVWTELRDLCEHFTLLRARTAHGEIGFTVDQCRQREGEKTVVVDNVHS